MEIIAFTGFSCTGKSTIIRHFNHNSNWEVISFHQILKNISIRKGYKRIREWLNEYGAIDITTEGCIETIKSLHALHATHTIIDGLYSKNLVEEIKRNFEPEKFSIIHIICNKQIRIERMAKRQNIDLMQSQVDLEMIDNYKIDAGINDIFKIADLTIENNSDINLSLTKLNTFYGI